jgi:LmbE family N-acetylglucosaminyl deacetylase
MKHLILAPHPDDEVLGCGGAMARAAARGEEVHVAVVTRGAADKYPAEAVDRIRAELREAHERLGVSSVRFLDFPAPRLDAVPRSELADALAAAIREVEPDWLYVPHHGDIHADHGAVYHAALVAARPHPERRLERILAYETPSETEWSPPHAAAAFLPTVYVDISDWLERKLEAMSRYQSQLRPAPQARSLEAIAALARHRGATIHCAAAEAFQLVREIVA